MKNLLATFMALSAFALLLSPSIAGRTALDVTAKGNSDKALAEKDICVAAHRVGKIVLAVNNTGTIGNGFVSGADCFTGEFVPSCEYPRRSNASYLYAGAFWVGAVVGRDTLVSFGADGWSGAREMYPDDIGFAYKEKRSIIDPTDEKFEGAISEEDYLFTYTDTATLGVPNDFFGRPHRPLNIEVFQRSFAWSYAYAEDFVLFDYEIRNIGVRTLEKVYMGLYVDADVQQYGSRVGFDDDICGFLQTIPSEFRGCDFVDTVNIAWIADNDGDLQYLSDPSRVAVPDVTGMRIVRTPSKELNVSFNWWIGNQDSRYDFGPRHKKNFRDFRTNGLGTPEGDVNKYHVLSNKEFDYDQVYTSTISPTDPVWYECARGSVTQQLCEDFADGFDTRYLLSFGPFDIDPGQRLPLSFAYVGGQGFHTYLNNLDNLPANPDLFYDSLHFEDLGLNSRWAGWIYDNPGVDTDNDKFFGLYRLCVVDSTVIDSTCVDTTIGSTDTTICTFTFAVVDTQWYEGDGVPDFQGASPPPAPSANANPPTLSVIPTVGKIYIRFNGVRSETTRDVFSRAVDFEGYRIYIARDERAGSFSLVTSYDRDNYNKYIYADPPGEWRLYDAPFTIDELRCLYADSCTDPFFHPLNYTTTSPLTYSGVWGDSIFYFAAQDYNNSDLGVPGAIRKVYINQPFPSSLNPDSARPEELTKDGLFKYFEYEYEIDNLLPTVPYWVNVTAFDYGSPQSGLPSLESSRTNGAVRVYPLNSADTVAANDLKVFVYPNPYRIDGNYQRLGLEGRNPEQSFGEDYLRQIHFANLPAECTISIFTLDGDLVREIVHNVNTSDPNASHEEWDMITRNRQLVVSGIYYWTVEEPNGETQIGKLVIIL